MKKRIFKLSPKAIIYATVFLDVIGIGLVIPVLPFYVESFGVGHQSVTALFAVFALCSFLSSPILGMLSDRKGRRPILLVSLASSAVGWLIFALSHSIIGLFIGRIIDGLAAGNISTAQNYLIDISKDDRDRAKNLGGIGAVFGIAFIIGPLIGGTLSKIYLPLPFIVVGILATLNTITAYYFLPETHHDRNTTKFSPNPFKPIKKAFSSKRLAPLYLVWLLFGIAITTNQSIFSLYIDARFGWKALAAGLMMTMVGVIISLNQAFLIKKVWLKYFKERTLNLWLLPPFALGYIFMGMKYVWAYLLGLIITAFGQSIYRVTMTSQMVGTADKREQGETVGVMMSVMSLSMIIGPVLGGLVYGYNIAAPFWLATILVGVTFIVLATAYKYLKKHEHVDIQPVETI